MSVPRDTLIQKTQRHHYRQPFSLVTSGIVVVISILALAIANNSGVAEASQTTHQSSDGLSITDTTSFRNEGNLAFVSSNRLFVLNGATGSLRRVTGPAHQASDPQFSPNGRWLTYSLDNGQVWLAHADGSNARLLPTNTSPQWLPSSQLVNGTSVLSVPASGVPIRSGSVTIGLAGWSPNGHEYVFDTDSLVIDPPKTSYGTERLTVSSSLTGKQTLWYETPTSFNATDGIHGNFIESVTVLPDNEGLLVSTDPDRSDDADGSGLYEIRSPGAPLKELAVTLKQNVGGDVSLGTDGNFVVGAGGDRYAWADKSVEICNAVAETCRPVQTPPNVLSLDPVWSPNHSAIAFIEAAKMPDGNIGQQVVLRWYATHQLAWLKTGSTQPSTLAGTKGAATPIWSSNGKSLLFVADDGLWLIRSIGTKPIEIVAPLFSSGAWPSYYGEVNWENEFAWSLGQ